MKQAYYHRSIEEFLATKDEEIVGILNLAGVAFAQQWTISTISWENSIKLLKNSFLQLIGLNPLAIKWKILLEYEIPRLASRIDAVLIADDLIFVIEFKYDRKKFQLADLRQVEDYALDLNDFHFESKDKVIIPVLFAPLAESIQNDSSLFNNIMVKPSRKANSENLFTIIYDAYRLCHDENASKIDSLKWEQSEYRPTPTIVQAARALFAGQKVEDISKTGADNINLSKTTEYLIHTINEARKENKKVVCFVTGVPGAGKTLVGLNIVHEKDAFSGHDFDTAYFSGNGPLIKVLREALTRDHFEKCNFLYRNSQLADKPKKRESERKVESKIQNLHTFIRDGIRKKTPPTEKIVVFDEAQRCWDAKHYFNQTKRNQYRNRQENDFDPQLKSEAELLFEFMNRHEDWAVIIALVGGGQEINTGEAGITEWGNALKKKYSNWEVHISPQLLSGDSIISRKALFDKIPDNSKIKLNDDLHLDINQRSFRTNSLNNWVNAVIDNEPVLAFNLAERIKTTYPLIITRNLTKAKKWLTSQVKGTKRVGLVANSGALRLRPYGINVKEEINEAFWFLNDEKDVRSSYYLELVGTEFTVQGLELDWVGVCWDADLRRKDEEWDFRNFSGTQWQNIGNLSDRQYLLNKYRVLLTRAREGLIIFVPEGDITDETRLPEYYDPIFYYLKSCGLTVV